MNPDSERREYTRVLAQRIRRHAIRMTRSGKSSHVGAVLSIADILAVLYGELLNVRPQEPTWERRDRFILSKGHAGAGVYAALAETGFFSPDELANHYQNGSNLSGHVSHKNIPGVEVSTGSLGHGLGIGQGMAFELKRKGSKSNVVVLMSDGECDEGSNWEAILFSAHHKLDNLVAIVDYNKIQSLGSVAETIALEPFVDKWRAFGWRAIEIDGHSHDELAEAYGQVKTSNGKPTAIICHTIKGKGVSFMENTVLWHYRTPQGSEYEAALREIEKDS